MYTFYETQQQNISRRKYLNELSKLQFVTACYFSKFLYLINFKIYLKVISDYGTGIIHFTGEKLYEIFEKWSAIFKYILYDIQYIEINSKKISNTFLKNDT